MNAPQQAVISPNIEMRMKEKLQIQRESYLQEGFVDANTRVDRIDRAIDVLIRFSDKIGDALDSDFGCRPHQVTMLSDVLGSIASLKHAKKHVKAWMKSEKRSTAFPLNILGGKSRIEYQPKGVVGLVAPWNFPVSMVFQPMSGIFAAGNRIMIKPSEYTPNTSKIIEEMIGEVFSEEEAITICGGPEVGQAFSSLPFDHMIFTGATNIARHVMAAAAQNLVPVTLELGGKSPVVISRSAKLKMSLERILLGKTLNAGQICLAPDYLMIPEENLDEVIDLAKDIVASMYPNIGKNPQYTAIVNKRHFDRLSGYLNEAKERGLELISLHSSNHGDPENVDSQKIPPILIPNPQEDMAIMQEELFGPILPVKTYRDFEECISYINSKPRPLAVYYFGKNGSEESDLISRTTSGGFCINDVVMQVAQEDLPFGGVGDSGMGSYHGLEGFRTFSHAKSVYKQTKINFAKLGGLMPPYGENTEKSIKMQLKK